MVCLQKDRGDRMDGQSSAEGKKIAHIFSHLSSGELRPNIAELSRQRTVCGQWGSDIEEPMYGRNKVSCDERSKREG
jgi:hypothetical protein